MPAIHWSKGRDLLSSNESANEGFEEEEFYTGAAQFYTLLLVRSSLPGLHSMTAGRERSQATITHSSRGSLYVEMISNPILS
jgi:hypothetical protein